MTGPAPHAVLAAAHHDEAAREQFLVDLRREVVRQARGLRNARSARLQESTWPRAQGSP
ncbi:MAG: hypothetical protein O3C65_02765 [Proteobacteria bacterium]|nr:hypothetical protein [Pseudomonadota bacterium]